MKPTIPNRNLLILRSDRRKIEMHPASLSEQVSHQILVVQTLHHRDNDAICLSIQAGIEGICEIIIGLFTCGLHESFIGLHRIIDDDRVRSQSRLPARKRPGSPKSVLSSFENFLDISEFNGLRE